jgi:miniconductance mechanosensitive channel
MLVGVIIAISIIIDKSPVGLLTGLGASAAVISFIFKDTLMGLVAGVQLAANNMLKVGDWIEVPSRGVDGVVESVSLTTVKVRSWNNTVQTIPPYVLISEPFGNWQAMRDSGGRRIKRSLNVDMTSVMFATDDMLKSLQEDKIASKMLEGIELVTPEGEPLTNLDLFMRATMRYVENHPRVNHNMLVLVRQLQPTQWGLPMELYFFSSDVNWVPYETLQAEVISCIVALAPHFSLRLYQAPSSLDLRS